MIFQKLFHSLFLSLSFLLPFHSRTQEVLEEYWVVLGASEKFEDVFEREVDGEDKKSTRYLFGSNKNKYLRVISYIKSDLLEEGSFICFVRVEIKNDKAFIHHESDIWE